MEMGKVFQVLAYLGKFIRDFSHPRHGQNTAVTFGVNGLFEMNVHSVSYWFRVCDNRLNMYTGK